MRAQAVSETPYGICPACLEPWPSSSIHGVGYCKRIQGHDPETCPHAIGKPRGCACDGRVNDQGIPL